MYNYRIGICGFGVVGTAMYDSFKMKEIDVVVYDKYKGEEFVDVTKLYQTDIIFVALPTPYDKELKCYDISSFSELLSKLVENDYQGVVVIKSTVEPGTTEKLTVQYKLNFVHNPEFLSAKSAFHDFQNQTHIVLGKSEKCSDKKFESVVDFYKRYYEKAFVSICSSTESESMKLFINSFYATKVQFFTEMYLTCQKIGVEYDVVKEMMLKNGWINKMHTQVPGTDGKISYGGMCFPKDTSSLLQFMKRLDTPHCVLEAVVTERNEMRTE